MAEKFFQARLWDYSKERFQFRGHICLKFSFYWVLLAFGFEYLLFPLFRTMNNSTASEIKLGFTIILILLILTDFAFMVWNKFWSGTVLSPASGPLKHLFLTIIFPLIWKNGNHGYPDWDYGKKRKILFIGTTEDKERGSYFVPVPKLLI